MSTTPRTDAFFHRKPSGRSFIQEVKEQMSGLEIDLAAMTELAKGLATQLQRQLEEVRFALASDDDSEASLVHCADIEANTALTLAREKGLLPQPPENV